MPVQKVYFSIPPVNDSSTQMNNTYKVHDTHLQGRVFLEVLGAAGSATHTHPAGRPQNRLKYIQD